MDYPSNFNTAANPAARGIAISRMMAILTAAMFLVAVFLCGLLVWSARSDRLVPFIISTNSQTGEWVLIGQNSGELEYSATRTIQESIVLNFVSDWFTILPDKNENESRWERCDRSICSDGTSFVFGSRLCTLYCSSGDDVYTRFSTNILPRYREYAENGGLWTVFDSDINITPIGKISDNGGTWRVDTIIHANDSDDFKIQVFIKIARNMNYYPGTMGFYVADFNAYKLEN
jgi:hypothetical protein